MPVAFDATNESHTGTTPSTSEASYDFTLTPVGTPRGLVVFTFVTNSSTETATSVKIDPTGANTDVPAVPGGSAADTATEQGRCTAWFLGSGIPASAFTIRTNRTNNTNEMYTIAATVTAASDTKVHLNGIKLEQENQALTEEYIDDGSTGVNSLRFCGMFTGAGVSINVGGSSTRLHEIIIAAARGATACRETNPTPGSRPVGFSIATDDVAGVYLAVREIETQVQTKPVIPLPYYPTPILRR